MNNRRRIERRKTVDLSEENAWILRDAVENGGGWPLEVEKSNGKDLIGNAK